MDVRLSHLIKVYVVVVVNT